MEVQRASQIEREGLGSLRAKAWRGVLTEAQYLERNRRLYAHPFGKKMDTFVLKNNKRAIVSSLDSLSIRLLTKEGAHDGNLIANVITPEEERGKGYATELLKLVLRETNHRYSILYSDIGPKFYESFEYVAFPAEVRERPPIVSEAVQSQSLDLPTFISRLHETRRVMLDENDGRVAVLHPDETFFDWHIERYRYFAECVGKKFPEDLFWRLDHGHLCAAFPDFLSKRLDGFWICSECEACVSFLGHQANSFGLLSLRYWGPNSINNSKVAWPMLKSPSSEQLLNSQLCDWW